MRYTSLDEAYPPPTQMQIKLQKLIRELAKSGQVPKWVPEHMRNWALQHKPRHRFWE